MVNNKKRILHVLSSNSYSGAEKVVIDIMSFLGDQYDFLYCCPNGDIEKQLKENNINYVFTKHNSITELKKVIKEYNPDIIHSHDYNASVKCSFIKGKIPLIQHLHNNSLWIRKLCIKSLLYLYAGKRADEILVVSESIINEYIFSKYIHGKVQCIDNPIGRNSILDKLKHEITEYDKKYDICCVARISEAKNPNRFAKIIFEIKKTLPNVKAVWIGDGELRNELENSIKKLNLENNLFLLGFKKNPYDYLVQSKLFMLTSSWEGFGLSVYEALSLGLPCIVSNVGGLSKIVDNECGCLCADDSDFIRNSINLLNNRKSFEKYSKNAIRKSIALDNTNTYFDKITEIYDNIYSERVD